MFKYQLELGHNTEAYNAMIENPDPSRRKDCLRQLLIMLCDRGDLQSLVDFPYTDLEEEVCDLTFLHFFGTTSSSSTKFRFNMQVQEHHPHQWAPLQVAG